MRFGYFLRCNNIHELQAAHSSAIIAGEVELRHEINLTVLQTLTLLRPLPPPSISLTYAISLFHSLPHPRSTIAHNLLIRLLLYIVPPSPLPAISLFSRLRRLSLSPDHHSFPLALSACSRLRFLAVGRTIHAQTIRFGLSSDLFVCNALISMYSSCSSLHESKLLFHDNKRALDIVSHNALLHGYAKAGDMKNAGILFQTMLLRDSISYGTMISGYFRAGLFSDALHLLDQMQSDGIEPDNAALTSALSCCAQIGDLNRGKAIDDYIRNNRYEIGVHLLTGLIDMYAKCGAIETAVNLFNESSIKNQFTWNAIIVGLAMHGYGKLSLDYFEKMLAARVRPDGITFIGVFVACSHSGFVETARNLFREMERLHGVKREMKHYGSMADLLGRAGLIDEAMEMVREMPMKGDAFVWGGVLAGCRIHHGNVEAAERAARRLLELDPGDTGVYSIMAGIYVDEGRWDDVKMIRRIMDAVKMKTNTGISLVSIPFGNEEDSPV